ncbi:MAG TPA: Fe-S cluster assembly protein HesB, partial [Actinomycetota bacterium]|nr:Fe-S cluster assembly protein HesB [Actinomycetota bacterium]
MIAATAPALRLPLVGGGGEPVDLWRTIVSHGVASLPPMFVDEQGRTLTVTLPLASGRPRRVRVSEGGRARARVEVTGKALGQRGSAALLATLRRVLALDQDLSSFYDAAAEDPDLKWVTEGAGRMVRSPTVFEDVVKTVCTTNCSWALTEKMVGALVEHLGERAAGAPATGTEGRAFPTPEAMAKAGIDFYREVVRAGYRGPYLQALARSVYSGEVDLEELAEAPVDEIPDDEVERRLLALPGVGPYAAAHVMMIIGRPSRIILDSWTRPTYARSVGKRKVSDGAIARRFRRYGRFAGLAFWLFITQDWVE